MTKALAYDFDTVIPGHGPVAKKADLAKWVKTIASLRGKIQAACGGGPVGEAGKRLDLTDLGMKVNPMMERGMAGMCGELGR